VKIARELRVPGYVETITLPPELNTSLCDDDPSPAVPPKPEEESDLC